MNKHSITASGKVDYRKIVSSKKITSHFPTWIIYTLSKRWNVTFGVGERPNIDPSRLFTLCSQLVDRTWTPSVCNTSINEGPWLLKLKPNKSGRINVRMKATMCTEVTGSTLGANITVRVNLHVTSCNLVHCSVFLSNSILYTWILWAFLFLFSPTLKCGDCHCTFHFVYLVGWIIICSLTQTLFLKG
jgi:hypothetical protein